MRLSQGRTCALCSAAYIIMSVHAAMDEPSDTKVRAVEISFQVFTHNASFRHLSSISMAGKGCYQWHMKSFANLVAQSRQRHQSKGWKGHDEMGLGRVL